MSARYQSLLDATSDELALELANTRIAWRCFPLRTSFMAEGNLLLFRADGKDAEFCMADVRHAPKRKASAFIPEELDGDPMEVERISALPQHTWGASLGNPFGIEMAPGGEEGRAEAGIDEELDAIMNSGFEDLAGALE